MYRAGGGAVTGIGVGGGLAATGAPIIGAIVLAAVLVFVGLLVLRSAKLRRNN